MRWSWKSYYAALFVYRSAFSVAGELLIAPHTSLGDAHRYQVETPLAFAPSAYRWSDAMTDTVGAVFRTVTFGNPILSHLLFQTLAFLGIVTLLRRLDPAARRTMAVLVMLPSFTLWSSVASKEAITTMAICLVCTYVIDLYQSTPRVRLPHVIGAYLLLVYKPLFCPALALLVGVSLLARHVRLKTLLVTCVGLASLVALYFTRDLVDAGVQDWMDNHPPGRSNRAPFFVEQYDVFTKAVPGMILAFVGPTWIEAQRSVLHLASFAESLLLTVTLAGLVARRFVRIPVYGLVLALFTTFWLMFVTYPGGVLNPGSAVRYRANYIVIIFLLVTMILSREVFENWKRRTAARHRGEGWV